jgi:formate C-acetyltransferase
MPLLLEDDELIVGYYIPSIASFRYGQGLYAYNFDRSGWSRAEIAEAEKAIEFWNGKTTFELHTLIPNVEGYRQDHEACSGGQFGCHHLINYRKLLRLGVPGLREHVETHAHENGDQDFYDAMLAVCDALAVVASRYGQEAAKLAQACPDGDRRAELEQISQVCAHVSQSPPETFWQAAQLMHFAHMLDTYEGFGRLDQYLYPFYRADLDSGQIDDTAAAEIIGCMMLRTRYHGSDIYLSGVTPEGHDATNDLSWIILELAGRYSLSSPEITVRYHSRIPESFFRRVCRLVAERSLNPAVYNDDVVIPSLVEGGFAVEDARDYAGVGCNHVLVPGISNNMPQQSIILIKCLLLALNDGISTKTGRQLGARTGKPEHLTSFEDLWRAYDAQIDYFTARMQTQNQWYDRVRMEQDAYSVRTLLTDDCVERGLSLTRGGARYNNSEVFIDAVSTTADSLTAIKKVVFEEKRVALPELVEALRTDFQDREDLRLYLLNRIPKYGNDDDSADEMAAKVFSHISEKLARIPTVRGGRWVATPNVGMGTLTNAESVGSASPDGRHATDPLGDSLGPAQGRDRNGPTAMINSVTKLDTHRAIIGGIVNMKFHPTMVAGEGGPDVMSNLLSTYFAKGGLYAQLNVVDDETLLEAQHNPERHRDLVVRVAGYSANFVDLPRSVQDDIIHRTAASP